MTPFFNAIRTEQLRGEIDAWMGTPWRYQGNDSNGIDCGNLVRRVLVACGAVPADWEPPVWPLRWYESDTRERLVEELSKLPFQMTDGIALDGDLMAFRMTVNQPQSHLGIVVDGGFVHALAGVGVISTPLSDLVWGGRFGSLWRPVEV